VNINRRGGSGMRKVEICGKGMYGGIGPQEPSELCRGVFHGFFSEGSNDEGIECYAAVEVPGGAVRMVATHKMRFLEEQRSESNSQKDAIALCKQGRTKAGETGHLVYAHLFDGIEAAILAQQHQ